MEINDIRDNYNLSIKQIAEEFEIPYETVRCWFSTGQRKRTCPEYVVKMMERILEGKNSK